MLHKGADKQWHPSTITRFCTGCAHEMQNRLQSYILGCVHRQPRMPWEFEHEPYMYVVEDYVVLTSLDMVSWASWETLQKQSPKTPYHRYVCPWMQVLHQQPVNGNSPKRIGCSHQPQRTASHKSDKDDVFLPDFSSFFMPWHPFQIFTTYILKLNIMHGADFYV